MMEASSDNSTSRRSSDLNRPSPSYFKNVVSLGPGSMSPIPLLSKATNSPSTGKRNTNTDTTHSKSSTDKHNLNIPDTHGSNTHDSLIPVASPVSNYTPHNHLQGQGTTPIITNVRSRKGGVAGHKKMRKQHHRGRRRKRLTSEQQHPSSSSNSGIDIAASRCCCCFGSCTSGGGLFWCCHDRKIVRSTLSCMNVVARILSWCTVVAMAAGVVWYSYELKKTG